MSNYEEILTQHDKAVARRVSRMAEHRLQTACVTWFRLQFPRLAMRLFAIPNGAYRAKTTAARLKDEGVLPGVADLFLAAVRGQWGGLFIEMKTNSDGSRLSKAQREWAGEIRNGYGYVICRSLEDFQYKVKRYLSIVSWDGTALPDDRVL